MKRWDIEKISLLKRRAHIFDSLFYRCFGYGKKELLKINQRLDHIEKLIYRNKNSIMFKKMKEYMDNSTKRAS